MYIVYIRTRGVGSGGEDLAGIYILHHICIHSRERGTTDGFSTMRATI